LDILTCVTVAKLSS